MKAIRWPCFVTARAHMDADIQTCTPFIIYDIPVINDIIIIVIIKTVTGLFFLVILLNQR